jgi:Family of unknown function (DUF5947)
MSASFTASSQSSAFAMLRQLARKRASVERCEMCSEELAPDHEHLVEPHNRRLICACGACAILFEGQSGTKYKRVPRRVIFLKDFQMTDTQWDELMVPIDMAFFFHSTPHGKMIALYPSPAGPTESLLPLDTWTDIIEANPILSEMHSDVCALLVNRTGHGRESHPSEYYWLVLSAHTGGDFPVVPRSGVRSMAFSRR